MAKKRAVEVRGYIGMDGNSHFGVFVDNDKVIATLSTEELTDLFKAIVPYVAVVDGE